MNRSRFSLRSLSLPAASSLLCAFVLLAGSAPAGAAPATVDGVSLRGVDPRVYLKARRPVPLVLRELRALPAEVSVRILEGETAGFLAPDDAFPEALKEAEREALRALEERALVTGALAAIAEKDDRRAPALIARFLSHEDPLVRAEAAERLGQTSAPNVIERLVQVAWSDGDETVRGAACAGLGHQRSAAALEALTPFVLDDPAAAPGAAAGSQGFAKDGVRQVAAIRALATLGSAWAWEARGDIAQGARLRGAARALLERLRPQGEAAIAADEVLARLR
jgi:HEAT repeat protein